MKKTGNQIALLICLIILAQPVLAGEIIFIAESPVIYDPLNDEVSIYLDVRNTLGEDVPGSFTWTVRDQDNVNYTQSSTDTRVIFSDPGQTVLRIQQKDGHEYLVDVTFDYLDFYNTDIAYHVALTGISLIPVGRADSASSGTALESLQARISKGALQQPGLQERTGIADSDTGSFPPVKTGNEDIESVSKLLEMEKNALITEKNRLWSVVNESAIYLVVDEILKDSGYSPDDPVIIPGSGAYNDEFELIYSGLNDSEIKVSGDIENREVLFINIESFGRIPLLWGIEENKTYISLDSDLLNQDYSVSKSIVNITPGAAFVNVFYEKGISIKVLDISAINGEPVSVNIRNTDDGIHFIFPFLIITLTVIFAFFFYRMYLKYSQFSSKMTTWEEKTFIEENSASPKDLLEESYRKYLQGEMKEAFSKAGCALRLNISAIYCGINKNLTNSQALAVLELAKEPEFDCYSDVLAICDSIVYGNINPEKGNYPELYSKVKNLVDQRDEFDVSTE